MNAAGTSEGLRGNGSQLGLDMALKTRSCSLHHLAAPLPVARPCPVWLCMPHPWEGWEADLQPDSVQGAGNSPHLGLHHADPLLPQPLHAVKHIHLPLHLPHLQEEVQGDEGTCPPDPCAADTENWGVCTAQASLGPAPKRSQISTCSAPAQVRQVLPTLSCSPPPLSRGAVKGFWAPRGLATAGSETAPPLLGEHSLPTKKETWLGAGSGNQPGNLRDVIACQQLGSSR